MWPNFSKAPAGHVCSFSTCQPINCTCQPMNYTCQPMNYTCDAMQDNGAPAKAWLKGCCILAGAVVGACTLALRPWSAPVHSEAFTAPSAATRYTAPTVQVRGPSLLRRATPTAQHRAAACMGHRGACDMPHRSAVTPQQPGPAGQGPGIAAARKESLRMHSNGLRWFCVCCCAYDCCALFQSSLHSARPTIQPTSGISLRVRTPPPPQSFAEQLSISWGGGRRGSNNPPPPLCGTRISSWDKMKFTKY